MLALSEERHWQDEKDESDGRDQDLRPGILEPPKEPIYFTKATSCLNGPNDDVMLPLGAEKGDWEVELGIIIGKKARYVEESEALDYVAGFVFDISELKARELALHESMRQIDLFRHAMDELPVAAFIKTAERKIEFVNKAWSALTGPAPRLAPARVRLES